MTEIFTVFGSCKIWKNT